MLSINFRYYAVKNNHPDVMSLLLKNKANLEDDLEALAIKDGYSEIVMQLSLNAERATEVLSASVQRGDVDLVGSLLSQGANPNLINRKTGNGQTPLCIAVQSNNPRMVKALLSRHGEVSRRRPQSREVGTTPKRKQSIEVHETKVDLPNSVGQTPLQVGTSAGVNVKIIKYLIKNGANVSKIKLTDAFKKRNGAELARTLIQNGADTSRVSLASVLKYENAAELAPMLVKEVRIDPNAYTGNGDTLLCIAAAAADLKSMEILISKCGADANRTGRSGKSPLSIAKEMGHTDVEDFLYNSGAVDAFATRCIRCFTSPRFKHGLCQCCDAGCMVCCDIWLNPTFYLAKSWRDYGFCGGTCVGCCCACTCCGMYLLRQEAAKTSGINENCCGTCCAITFCPICVAAQIYNESVAQGVREKAECLEWCTGPDYWCDDDCYCRSCGSNGDGGCYECTSDTKGYLWLCDSTCNIIDTGFSVVTLPALPALYLLTYVLMCLNVCLESLNDK